MKILFTSRLYLIIFLLICATGLVVFVENNNHTKKSDSLQPGIVANLISFSFPETYDRPLELINNSFSLAIKPANAQQAVKQESDRKVTYVDAYPGTDVVITKDTHKIKEDIILKTPEHPAEFTYIIENPDQYLIEKNRDGDIIFYNKEAIPKLPNKEVAKVFTIPAPFLIDANGVVSKTESVVTTFENGLLTLTPDPEWLATHSYPIILDPTVEINILNLHSHPQQGEDWVVSFTTQGTADLYIRPFDQATIDDDVFVSLTCDEENREPQILTDDVIFYPNWQCDGVGKVTHYTAVAGKHTLEFDFGGQIAYAYNSSWWNTSWGFRRKITFNTTTAAPSENLTNYPAGIQINASRIDYAETKDAGEDIRFVDANDSTELDYEIERWNESGTSVVWVEVPQIAQNSSTDYIWMYYGNSGASDNSTTTGVWDDNYIAVYHFGETAGNYSDSSNYGNDSSALSVTSRTATGKLGYAPDLEQGSSNSITITAILGEVSETHGTLEAWVNVESTPDEMHYVWYGDSAANGWGGEEEVHLATSEAIGDGLHGMFVQANADAQAEGGTINAGSWEYIAGTYEPVSSETLAIVYENGSSVDSNASTSGLDSAQFGAAYIGRPGAAQRYYDGIIDEVRISDINRSAQWIAFTYCHIQETCISYGSEESAPITAAAPTITDIIDSPDPVNSGSSVTFAIDWSDVNGDITKAKICKTNAFSNQNCTGGYWASSTVFTPDDPEYLTYFTTAADGDEIEWYGFVCDDGGLCSAATSGTTTINLTPSSGIRLRSGTIKINNLPLRFITDYVPWVAMLRRDDIV